MLVETHGPERHHLAVGISVEFGQSLESVSWNAGELRRVIKRIGRDELGVFLIAYGLCTVGIVGVFSRLLQRMLWTQTVADVSVAELEVAVFGDKVLVDSPRADDVVSDVIENGQVGLRLESQRHVRQLVRTVLEGRQHGHLYTRRGQTPISHARPQHRMHFSHV